MMLWCFLVHSWVRLTGSEGVVKALAAAGRTTGGINVSVSVVWLVQSRRRRMTTLLAAVAMTVW